MHQLLGCLRPWLTLSSGRHEAWWTMHVNSFDTRMAVKSDNAYSYTIASVILANTAVRRSMCMWPYSTLVMLSVALNHCSIVYPWIGPVSLSSERCGRDLIHCHHLCVHLVRHCVHCRTKCFSLLPNGGPWCSYHLHGLCLLVLWTDPFSSHTLQHLRIMRWLHRHCLRRLL